MTGSSAYLTGLDRNEANYTPLTPLTFLERAAYVHPDHPSVIYGLQRFTWRETYARCRRLASALTRHSIGKNDTVAVMAPVMAPVVELLSPGTLKFVTPPMTKFCPSVRFRLCTSQSEVSMTRLVLMSSHFRTRTVSPLVRPVIWKVMAPA